MGFGDVKIINGRVIINPAGGTVWLTQYQIADLFECFVAKVSSNVRAILKADILDERKVCRLHRYDNGNSVELYNLEMIAALAFRVQSTKAQIFRRWIIRKVVRTDLPQIILLHLKSTVLN